MNRLFILMATVLFLLIMAGCAPSPEESQAAFCRDLAAYGRAVDELQNITADTTVDELNSARDNVVNAHEALLDSAGDLRQSQIRQVEAAWENAQNEIESISGEATLDEAATTIRGQALVLAAEVARVRNFSCFRR